MRQFAAAPRPIALCTAILVSLSPAAAQQPGGQPPAPPQPPPQQAQTNPQIGQMPQGAWPGGMPGPMHRGMMNQGQPAPAGNMQQPNWGPGMMRGPMHQGMPMPQQTPPGQPDMPQEAPVTPGNMPGPMMGGPMMGGPGMPYGPMGGPMMGGPMMGGMCPMGAPDFAEGRIAFLKAELAITDKQQEAFDAFAKVAKGHAEGRHERHHAMMQKMHEAQSPLDRLGARITMMETRLGMMKEMHAAAEKLYGVLTDEQKQKADFLLPGMGGMRCMM